MIYSHMRHENRNKTIWKKERRKRKWRVISEHGQRTCYNCTIVHTTMYNEYTTINIFYLICKRKKESIGGCWLSAVFWLPRDHLSFPPKHIMKSRRRKEPPLLQHLSYWFILMSTAAVFGISDTGLEGCYLTGGIQEGTNGFKCYISKCHRLMITSDGDLMNSCRASFLLCLAYWSQNSSIIPKKNSNHHLIYFLFLVLVWGCREYG